MNTTEIRAIRGVKPGFKRLLTLLCDDIDPARFAKVQRSPDWLERAAIARHPKTPEDVLNHLTHDGNSIVKVLAEESLSRKQDVERRSKQKPCS